MTPEDSWLKQLYTSWWDERKKSKKVWPHIFLSLHPLKRILMELWFTLHLSMYQQVRFFHPPFHITGDFCWKQLPGLRQPEVTAVAAGWGWLSNASQRITIFIEDKSTRWWWYTAPRMCWEVEGRLESLRLQKSCEAVDGWQVFFKGWSWWSWEFWGIRQISFCIRMCFLC